MKIQTVLLLLVLALVAGCQGIAPTSRQALDAAATEMQLIRDADERDRRALLVDLRETLMDWAADLADADLRRAAVDGLTLKEAQSVLDKYRTRQASAQKKVGELSSPLRVAAVVLYDDRPALVIAVERRLKLRLADGTEVVTARSDIRVKTRAGRFRDAKELLRGVRDVLKALERRKDAEGDLQEKAAQGVKAGARRAIRGGF